MIKNDLVCFCGKEAKNHVDGFILRDGKIVVFKKEFFCSQEHIKIKRSIVVALNSLKKEE